MKRIANRIFLLAAAALSLGTAAYGQTTLRADVPFAFRSPGGVSASGKYTVQLENSPSGRIVRIVNTETRSSLLSVAYSVNENPILPITPRLVFRCGETSGCALSEIWTSTGGFGVPVKRVRRDPEILASIPLSVAHK